MHLLICSLSENIPPESIEYILSNNHNIPEYLWIKAENGKKEVENDHPIVGGSLRYLIKHEEENLLIAKILGVENAKSIASQIKITYENKIGLAPLIIPVVA